MSKRPASRHLPAFQYPRGAVARVRLTASRCNRSAFVWAKLSSRAKK